MAPLKGHSGPGNRSQLIAPDVPGLDPTLIYADPPVLLTFYWGIIITPQIDLSYNFSLLKQHFSQ